MKGGKVYTSSPFFYENRKEGSQVCFFALPLKFNSHHFWQFFVVGETQ